MTITGVLYFLQQSSLQGNNMRIEFFSCQTIQTLFYGAAILPLSVVVIKPSILKSPYHNHDETASLLKYRKSNASLKEIFMFHKVAKSLY